MSGRMDQRRANNATCDGKEQFVSFDLADAIAKKRSRRGKKGNVYKCGTCHAFHIGSSPWRRRKDQVEEEIEA